MEQMDKHELTLRYLRERLPPEDQQELRQLLGEGDKPDEDDSIASDALRGRHGLSFDALPERLKRQALARVRKAPDNSGFASRFHDAARVRVLR